MTEAKIKTFNDFKKAMMRCNYQRIRSFKNDNPNLYDEYMAQMKLEQDKERGMITF